MLFQLRNNRSQDKLQVFIVIQVDLNYTFFIMPSTSVEVMTLKIPSVDESFKEEKSDSLCEWEWSHWKLVFWLLDT